MADGWHHEDVKISSFSAGRLLDSYGGSICSSTCTYDQFSYLESADSDLLNSLNAPEDFYQMGLPMDNEKSFKEDLSQLMQYEEFFPSEECRSPSSTLLSSGRSRSMSSSEYSSLLRDNSVKSTSKQYPAMPATAARNVATIPSSNDQNDDAVVMRAMLAVITSSASVSSSAASPASVVSNPPPEVLIRSQAQPCGFSSAFKPCSPVLFATNSALMPTSEGQKMIKNSITMLRKIDLSKSEEEVLEELKPASNQSCHMISERRRREKLNWSFHELRMLLPPGSKKDKASVLNNARSYLNTLKAQIYELEEKNIRLETHLSTDQTEEITNCSSGGGPGGVRLQVTKSSEPIAEVQLINLRITARVEYDIVELVLQILECIKGLGITEVASVDAYTYSPQMHLFARANLKFQIKACDWNEACFQEAMRKAICGVSTAAATSS